MTASTQPGKATAGHTPGPWYSEEPTMGFGAIRAETGELIFGLAAGAEDERQSDEVCEANARLIAAAPELRDALERCLAELKQHAAGVSAAEIAIAECALAKANGGRG